MLKNLSIKDFAIIEDLSIDFNNGMSAILGETGAGKSIIIEAFSLLLGNRVNKDMIRQDKQKAIITALINFKDVPKELKEYQDEDSNDFIFTRILNKDGNNYAKINGILVNSSILKNTLAKKVNLHSQHDLFYLLDSKYHLSLLDKFIGNKLTDLLDEYNTYYKEYLTRLAKYNDLVNQSNDIDIDYVKYQLEEIEKINVKENELEEIELELNRTNKFDKISNSVNNIIDLFDRNQGISDLLYEFKRNYLNISDDPLFSDYKDEIIDLIERINDTGVSIKEAYNTLDFDPNRVEYLKTRLFTINKLKRKYGSYNDINNAKEEYIRQIEYYNDKDYYLNNALNKINEVKQKAEKLALEISNLRKENAKVISLKVIEQLKDLYLDKTKFEVEFTKTDLTSLGIDKVEFKISTNVGENTKPLSVVASGGEASRITLALNVVFNEIYDINLAIFDEVDSGVSGKVARSMGKKIKELSNYYQTITISHLPQVLTYADNFYYIGKQIKDNKTRSYVKVLNKDQQILEIAKILSGNDSPSESFIENAKELLNN